MYVVFLTNNIISTFYIIVMYVIQIYASNNNEYN